MKHKTLSIIIPAYNEARTLFMLLEKVHHTRLVENIQKEIIVIKTARKTKRKPRFSVSWKRIPIAPFNTTTNLITKVKEQLYGLEFKKPAESGPLYRMQTSNTNRKTLTRY